MTNLFTGRHQRMRTTILVVVLGVVATIYTLTGYATRTRAGCEQVWPNPISAGNQHNINSRDGCNELDDFENFGTLINSGKFDNAGELRNLGKLLNLGKFNNFGEVTNVQSRSGNIRNDGTLNNFGNVTGFGSTNNNGILNNYGTFNAGDFGENSGVINNYADATLSSAQRYTNNGVVNNSLGATLKTKIGWINNGLISNSGKINFDRARFLINKGVLANTKGATLSTNHEITNAGLIQIDGAVTANGTISNVGWFHVSESGNVTGSGDFSQSAGVTVIDGEIAQNAINISGGKLSGIGRLTSMVTMDGGMLAPADIKLGVITVMGDYSQTAAGDLSLDIGGKEPGSEYDVLRISGTARLGGQLRVRLYDFGGGPFSPREGDQFDILRAETIVGEFAGLRLAPLEQPLDWQVAYLTDADGTLDVVRLIVTRDSQ